MSRRSEPADPFTELAAIADRLPSPDTGHHPGPTQPPPGPQPTAGIDDMLATFDTASRQQAALSQHLRTQPDQDTAPEPTEPLDHYDWLVAQVGYLDGLRAVQQRLLDADVDEELTPTADPHRVAWQRQQVEIHARETLTDLISGVTVPEPARERLVAQWVDDIVGLGPAEPYYQDPDVSEIVLLGPDRAMVERNGQLDDVDIHFLGAEHLVAVAQRLATRIGRKIDEADPMVDTRLPNGDRVNIVFPPVSLDGVIITIRKHNPTRFTLNELHHQAMFNSEMLELLRLLVHAQVNIVISGPTNSGKTTLARALAGEIPDDEYVVTIEDSAELNLATLHYRTASLEARLANSSGRGEVPIRRVVRNALRMRPNRIIVGEARGEEALDMLQAMNTGHAGSMTTMHANSVEDAVLNRIPDMAAQAGEVTLDAALRRTLAVLEVGIHLRQLRPSGRRIIDTVSAIIPTGADTATVAHIYEWDNDDWVSHGVIASRVLEKFDAAGFSLTGSNPAEPPSPTAQDAP